MQSSNYDVVVVGAGAAGLTAAIGLARAGFAVAVVEAAAFPGAENWSGCVYFCENLAHPEILGTDGVEALAWERRLVERGFFATDGRGLLGMTYRDPAAFRHCYTVLRPIYDHHLAQVALQHGVALLTSTTAESLIRHDGRIVGICTNRGPLYADLVFLAEGDASNLVTREGYERYTDQREAPKFLQGIKQVLELPPGEIEDRFGLGPEQGVAYEMLLRNGTLRGRKVRLNMGGFIYTNQQSLSIGLVLPVDNLHEHFDGDPNLLLEWFENLPSLRPWLRDGQRGAFGAKLIRGGGVKDIPTLIDDGLAIGGAASAIGIDFPYPNFTGPATAMGLLVVQAASRIRAEGGRFTRDNLRRFYLEPLQQTHYWHDVEFLRRWPGYVKKTRHFFGRNLDLTLGSAYLWTRSDRWFVSRWNSWLRLLLRVAGPGHWPALQGDARHLIRALRLRTILPRPALGRLLLDGTVNAFRDALRRPRANLPSAGQVQLHYTVAGGEAAGMPPRLVRRWFRRFAPVLASAARIVYTNDATPLGARLPAALRLLVKQINLLDLIGAATLGLSAAVGGMFLVGWDRLRATVRKRKDRASRGLSPGEDHFEGLYGRYTQAARQATDLTPLTTVAAARWEERLALLQYETAKASHIHVLWPRAIQDKNDVTRAGLWHVCPAHVYEARTGPGGQVQVIVNFENCIKCETCWRVSDLADWARDGRHRFIYAVHSPVVGKLLASQGAAGLVRPILPRWLNWWSASLPATALWRKGAALDDKPDAYVVVAHDVLLPHISAADDHREHHAAVITALEILLRRLERKLQEYDDALAEEPRTLNRSRAEYLEMLARYARQLAARVAEVLSDRYLFTPPEIMALAASLVTRAEERARQVWHQRFAWAAADGRQLRQHHLTGLRYHLGIQQPAAISKASYEDSNLPWLQAERANDVLGGKLEEWRRRLDGVLPATIWRDLERQVPLTPEQDAVVRDLLAQVPATVDGTMHPVARKALLAELARRDPSLAFRAAAHLWARDLAKFAPLPASLTERWGRAEEWACFAILPTAVAGAPGDAEALLIPALHAQSILVLEGNRLLAFCKDAAGNAPGLAVEPIATLGLRGAGLAKLRRHGGDQPAAEATVFPDLVLRAWRVLSAADLTSIAFGMADLLCQRAVTQATTRVQFPGLFQDEEARDAIGKFGAVKKMVAGIAARRYLIETLDYNLSPVDFSPASAHRAALVKATVAEALGTAPGSVAYNAGQVFGGTGYSEDDVLSKAYRDAAAWRFLGPDNVHAFLQRGTQLLDGKELDVEAPSLLPEEGKLFDEVAQRKALQSELDEIRVHRSRIRALGGEWQTAGARASSSTSARAEVSEALGRQDAHLLASKMLLLRTHARLEAGIHSETEIALLRVWLEAAAAALEEFHGVVRLNLDHGGHREDRPVVDPAAGPPLTVYDAFLQAPGAYESGDFLSRPVDLLQARFVPEMIQTDPALAAADQKFRDLLTARFGSPRDGLVYERYIERAHRPDAADLDYCRRHGFFRMPIPKALGGEARSKVEYYLLTTNTNRIADVSLSLTIQVNSSLGSTPVLHARAKDLPRAQKDLESFVGDATLQADIRERLQKLLEKFGTSGAPEIKQKVLDLQKRLDETILVRPALRVLAFAFVQAWQQAAQAGKQFALPTMRGHLQTALAAWQDACNRTAEAHEEIGRRREASDLFLRWVASGQISAFALTEPSAGSDTARVATRARLHSTPVETEPDGVLRFIPAGGKEPRYLLDARRLEFSTAAGNGQDDLRAYYRWSDTAASVPICFDEYDYESDDPERKRYYDHGGRRIYFTDIAQLRTRDGRSWYDYWELNGAKMWITNGRMAGIMCLYAKTDEGVTGFIVDRHAEGLVVGKDEAKMGQCGSPTNELSLQGVRVPRENVIGLEGRGQVNALETLNVGRAGLAMSAMAYMKGLIDASRDFASCSHAEGPDEGLPDCVAWRLEQMEEERFIAEALAHEIIGRFEHPQTKSVRLESAVVKMLVSELYHHLIEMAEEIHGLAGQTQLHLVEKRKRDARVLNIYEGTNEIQRFFILKDLASEVAPRWQAMPPAASGYLGPEGLELEALKDDVRKRTRAALETFGQQLWQNPNLQANCFLLAEAVAWLAAAESTLGRLAWLSRLEMADENAAPSPQIQRARRALARCHLQVRDRLKRFDDELTHLRRGYYAPEIRAAVLLFQQAAQPAPTFRPASQITRPLSVLVVLDALTPGVPHPEVGAGRLLEPYRVLSDADRSALETALRLREEAKPASGEHQPPDRAQDQAGDTPRSPGLVSVEVIAVGPPSTAQVLREALSLGAERVRLLVAEKEAVSSHDATAALAAVVREGTAPDLILGGGISGQEGVVVRLLAASLSVPFAGTAAHVALRATTAEGSVVLAGADANQQRVRSLPTAVALEPGPALRTYTVQGYLAGLAKPVEMLTWPAGVPAQALTFTPAGPIGKAASGKLAPRALSPAEASRLVLDTVGFSTGAGRASSGRSESPDNGSEPVFEEVAQPTFALSERNKTARVVAVLGTDADGRLGPGAGQTMAAARLLSASLGTSTRPGVLLVVGGGQAVERRAALEVARAFAPPVVTMLPVDAAQTSDEIRNRILSECLNGIPFAALVGEPWTDGAVAALAMARPGDVVALRVQHLAASGGALIIETAHGRGKLRARQTVTADRSRVWWITLADDAEVEPLAQSPASGDTRIERWSPQLDRLYGCADMKALLQEIKHATGVVRLADADFVIDVGFGVANQDGYETVIEPLERALRALGVRGLVVGGSRKVTEELHLLPLDRQIGQSGVSVNPRVLLAIGISGAPQHLNYIGTRATIVAFNRDPEAPLMTLNQRQPQPRVFPVPGNLFETVPALTAALQEEQTGQTERGPNGAIEKAGSRALSGTGRSVE
jgi:alkylation response protein AidB-like acyl-CoA dehydrogenase/flavin-dependent dehydrogenase/electron transfer flavoprotein alpha subunit/ferredoxin-like protein FixX